MEKNVKIKFEASKGAADPVKATIIFDDFVELPDYSELEDGNYQLTIVGGVASWTLIMPAI